MPGLLRVLGTTTVVRPRLQCSAPCSTHTRVRPLARTTPVAGPVFDSPTAVDRRGPQCPGGACDAEHWEATPECVNHRNGSPREWDTRAGTLEAAISRLLEGGSGCNPAFAPTGGFPSACLLPGLLSYLSRKNGRTIAEWAREVTPDGMQQLLGRAEWDADTDLDDVRSTRWNILPARSGSVQIPGRPSAVQAAYSWRT